MTGSSAAQHAIPSEPVELRYPPWHSAFEFAQGVLAALVCVWVAAVINPGLIAGALLLVCMLGFSWFAYRALARWRFSARLQDRKIVSSNGECLFDMDELSELSLAYYSTRRDRRSGWYRLELKSPDGSFEAESKMSGFEALVGAAAGQVMSKALLLDEVSRENLTYLCQPLGDGGGGSG